jgi:tetratricopeptide (TPR) repeat protein
MRAVPFRGSLTAIIGLSVVVAVSAAHAQSKNSSEWIGIRVMPKHGAVAVAGNTAVDTKDWALPYRVQAVSGDSLFVGDTTKGWMKRDQLLTLGEAPAYYSSLIDRGNYKIEAYHRRAVTWAETGQLDLAIADLTELIRLDPTDARYTDRGNLWADKKEYDRAIADYDQAIRLDPNATAYNNRAGVWRAKGEDDKASADYNEAIRLDPTFAMAYNNRGHMLYTVGEYDKAIADYDQAIRLDPNKAIELNNRALARCAKRQYDKALSDYEQAIRLDPYCAAAYNNRAFAWYRKKEYAKAVADFGEAMRLDPNHASIFQYAARSEAFLLAACPDENIRDADKAIKSADASLGCNPSDAYAQNAKACALALRREFDAAISLEEEALKDAAFRADDHISGGGYSQERMDAWKQKRQWFFTPTN